MISPLVDRRRLAGAAVLAVCSLLVACSAGSPGGSTRPSVAVSNSITPSATASPDESVPPSATPEATVSAAPEPSDNLGAFSCNQPASGVGSVSRAQITDVRVATHDGYDRIVFEFDGGIPAYRVEIVDPPFTADPSGLPLDVEGSEFLRVTFDGGTRMLPDGSSSYDGPVDFTPGFDELAQLIEGGDFEAVSTWYAGLATEPCIRVLTLADPSRLVVDIQH